MIVGMPELPRILDRHIEAGKMLHAMVPSWETTDKALDAVAKSFPDDDLASCLVKVVTVNSLYNTNVYAVWRMAEHVQQVLADPARPTGPKLVDCIAALGNRNHRSFASKYTHFFIDSAFPILDQYVLKMLAYHLGQRQVWPQDYVQFYGWFEKLRSHCDGQFNTKDIDQYLWMAGMYREFRRVGPGLLSKDVGTLFASQDPQIQKTLAQLVERDESV
ncbi:hypothetical protein MCEMSE15_00144 [Fimbriimonadaceae bacterium]